MSGLASRAEVHKLSRTLGADPAALIFLEKLPPETLRELRLSTYELLFGLDQRLVLRITRLLGFLPVFLVALIARLAGPLLAARVAGEMPARRAARMARRLPAPFVAEVCLHLDPRRARDLIRALPTSTILAFAKELVQRKDWITTGRFVDFLSDDAIRAVLDHLDDDESLLHISYYVESRNRLDHVVRLLPPERLRRAVLLAVDQERDLLAQVMALILNVSYALKRELGDLAAAQDEAVLNRVVQFTHEQGLWAELLPAVSALSVDAQRKVVNLPVLRENPAVLDAILASAHAHQLWGDVLPLVPYMEPAMREAVARIAALLPPGALAGPAHAALLGEQWEPLLDLAARVPPHRQRELAEVVRRFGEVDAELLARIEQRAQALGFGDAFTNAAALAA